MKHRSLSQKLTRWLLPALLALILPALAVGEALEIGTLEPVTLPAQQETGETALYLGPTQGFLREGDAALDTAAPFVCFGQADCWTMVAPGTPEDFGPVGWIESAALDALDGAAELTFADALEVMIEDDAPLTADPLHGDTPALTTLVRGTRVLLLARYDDWGYVQTELGGTPVRAFVPMATIL